MDQNLHTLVCSEQLEKTLMLQQNLFNGDIVTWPLFKIHTTCLKKGLNNMIWHYSDIIMSTMASQITSLTIVYSTLYSGTDQRKYQSSASLAFVLGIHRWPVNSPHKGLVTQKMFPFDDVIMMHRKLSKWLLHLHTPLLNSYIDCTRGGV